MVPHTTMISGSVTTIYSLETTTSLQPTVIPDPRQPPPPSFTYTGRAGLHTWQVGLIVALVLILLAICLAALILGWYRKRRQELQDQEDKVVGAREPWNDPATAAAVMGSPKGGNGSAGAAGGMHPGWHEYNKEASAIEGGLMAGSESGYHHVHHHHPDNRYGPNGELMLVGYTDPYGEDTSGYLDRLGHGRAYSGSTDDYGLGLDYSLVGSEIGGAELGCYSGSMAGDPGSYGGGGHRFPIPPHHQHQVVFSNHPQELQDEPTSPAPRASYEDDYHAAVAQRQQLQQQQQSSVYYPQSPQTSTSAAALSRQQSQDGLTVVGSAAEAAEQGSTDDYVQNLEKYSKVEHRRQSPHALLVQNKGQGCEQDGTIVASPVEEPTTFSTIISGGGGETLPGTGKGGDDLSSGSGHECGPSTPGEETAAALSYLDRLRVDESS
ncbi:hypothetical protein BGX29_009055 [Mortierella sp. GBA35]|nr:hypothetical protein BGX29_009055 [Mortierella sp. GBA35]